MEQPSPIAFIQTRPAHSATAATGGTVVVGQPGSGFAWPPAEALHPPHMTTFGYVKTQDAVVWQGPTHTTLAAPLDWIALVFAIAMLLIAGVAAARRAAVSALRLVAF